MTCVIGYQHKGDVLIAADSAVGHYGDMMQVAGRKYGIWDTGAGTLAIGFAGSGRLAQSLMARWQPPAPDCDSESYPYRVGESMAGFVQSLPYPDTFKGGDDSTAVDATCLVAWQGQLYVLSGGLCTMHWDRPYLGVGAGSEYVMGALEMVLKREGEPQDLLEVRRRVGQALEISAGIQEGVRPPFSFTLIEDGTVVVERA